MTLFDRVFGGNDAVYGLTEAAIDGAIAQYGADQAVAFPKTAYSLLRRNWYKSYQSWRIKRGSWSCKNSYDQRKKTE